MSNNNGSMVAVFYALGGNALIAMIKFTAAMLTSSAAMMAESIHSAADTLNQVFLLIGNKRSQKEPTEAHPFGHERESFYWALLVAGLLFVGGGIFSIYEGIHKIYNPEPIHNIYLIFVILLVSIGIEAKSFSVAYKEFKKNSKENFFHGIRNSTDTNLIVVLLEDFAALAGLIVVVITTVLSLFNPIFDAFGSICVGLLLLSISHTLANEIRKLIVGESMPRESRAKIKGIIHEYDIVEHINAVKTMAIGNNKYLVVISVDIDDDATGYDIEDHFEQIKIDIFKELPEVKVITIDIQDPNKSTLM